VLNKDKVTQCLVPNPVECILWAICSSWTMMSLWWDTCITCMSVVWFL